MSNKILVIEDEPNIIEAISFILKRDGWIVATHEDGRTAIAAVLRHAPDALVLDVMLPGRSGYDILEELRANESTRDLPILMLTARGQAKDREKAMQLGATRFMTKPFSNTEILKCLGEMVNP